MEQSENMSEPVEIQFTPLPSFIFLVQQSISISPDLGGVKLEWENIAEKVEVNIDRIMIEYFKMVLFMFSF